MKLKILTISIIFFFIFAACFAIASNESVKRTPVSYEIEEIVKIDVVFDISEETVFDNEELELYTSFRNIGSVGFDLNSSVYIDIFDSEENKKYNTSFTVNESIIRGGDLQEVKSVVIGDDFDYGEHMVNATVDFVAVNSTLNDTDGPEKGMVVDELYFSETFVYEEEEVEEEPDPEPEPEPEPSPEPEPIHPDISFVVEKPMQEIVQGRTHTIPYEIKNFGSEIPDFQLEIDGISEDFYTVEIDDQALKSGESRGLFLKIFSTDMRTGSYDIDLNVVVDDEIVTSTNSYIRIRTSTMDRPVLSRSISIDNTEDKSNVKLRVENLANYSFQSIEFTDQIPEHIPFDFEIVDFEPDPSEIFVDERQIVWKFIDFRPGMETEIEYYVDDVLSVDLDYSDWLIEHLTFQRRGLVEKVVIDEIEIEDIMLGDSGQMIINIRNIDENVSEYEFEIEVQEGVEVEPKTKKGNIGVNETKAIYFELKVSEDLDSGAYNVDIMGTIEDEMVLRKEEFEVVERRHRISRSLVFQLLTLMLLMIVLVLYTKKKSN